MPERVARTLTPALPPGLILGLILGLTVAVITGACASSPISDLEKSPSQAATEIAETKAAADRVADTVPPEAPTEDDGETAAGPSQPAAAEPAPPPQAPTRAPTTLVLREGQQFPTAVLEEPKAEAPTLYEASQAEQRRRQDNPPASVIITDANLQDYASGGNLTELITEPFEEDAAPSETVVSLEAAEDPETTWRQRARDARLSWRAAYDRVDELEARVAQLRFDFYAQDDPYYRDQEIKPAWDRAVDELDQAKLAVELARSRTERVLAAGLRDGAAPGWLREGLEYEPEPLTEPSVIVDDLPAVQVGEPEIVDEDPPR